MRKMIRISREYVSPHVGRNRACSGEKQEVRKGRSWGD